MAPNPSQPWKKNWPDGYQADTGSPNSEQGSKRGRTRKRDGIVAHRQGTGTPSPVGSKGATPHAISMVDGTRVMRLDDREALLQVLENDK